MSNINIVTEYQLSQSMIASTEYIKRKIQQTSDIIFGTIEDMAESGATIVPLFYDFVIPSNAWVKETLFHDYPYYVDFVIEGLKKTDAVKFILSEAVEALDVEFYSLLEVGEGIVKIRATEKPLVDIDGKYSINTLTILSTMDSGLIQKDFDELKEYLLGEFAAQGVEVSIRLEEMQNYIFGEMADTVNVLNVELGGIHNILTDLDDYIRGGARKNPFRVSFRAENDLDIERGVLNTEDGRVEC